MNYWKKGSPGMREEANEDPTNLQIRIFNHTIFQNSWTTDYIKEAINTKLGLGTTHSGSK